LAYSHISTVKKSWKKVWDLLLWEELVPDKNSQSYLVPVPRFYNKAVRKIWEAYQK